MKGQSKKIFYIVLILFIGLLIPLYAVGMYAHPSVDDYYYGAETAKVWKETGSFMEVMKASMNEMVRTYYDWQGNFSAIFLMRLQPGIFGEDCYFLTSVILISSYVVCSLFFFYTMLRKFMAAGRYTAGIISMGITFVSMQLTLVPSDAFYWFNGSIYYTFFYCMMLLLFGLMAYIPKGKSYFALLPLCTFISFAIGGSNFGTALFTAIILVLISGICIYLYVKKKDMSIWTIIANAIITIACLAGLIISITAPGNTIRQLSVGGSTGLVKTFLFTFAYGGYSLADVLSSPCIVFFVMLIPVFYQLAKRTHYSFKYPLFVLIFTFGLYCSTGTPVFYAQGLRIPYRLMNIIYFSAYSFIGFNLLYFCGWVSRKYGNSKAVIALEELFGNIKKDGKKLMWALCICLFAFLVTCIGLIEVNESESGGASFSNMPLSMSATYALISGDAAEYDAQLNSRAEYLASTTEEHVALVPLSVYPEPIFHTEITTDAAHWKNAHLALFYDKHSVWLVEE